MTRNDIASVFCFRTEQQMLEAYERVKSQLSVWTEKRQSVRKVMYPYWLVCRYDDCDDLGRVFEKSSLKWGDLEHPVYGPGVEDQSKIYFSAEDLKRIQEEKKRAEEERRRQEEKKRAEEERQRQEKKKAETQARRKSERKCIMCGKPLGFVSRLIGRDRHKECTEFLECPGE